MQRWTMRSFKILCIALVMCSNTPPIVTYRIACFENQCVFFLFFERKSFKRQPKLKILGKMFSGLLVLYSLFVVVIIYPRGGQTKQLCANPKPFSCIQYMNLRVEKCCVEWCKPTINKAFF